MSSGENFFDKFGVEVALGEVEVGQSYPLYGCITKFIDESFENFTVEINNQVTLRCHLSKEGFAEKVELLKKRAFEPGIFVSTITNRDPVQGECTTIVFGRPQTPQQV